MLSTTDSDYSAAEIYMYVCFSLGARIDCGLVALKHHAFNTDINITTTPWGRNMHLDEVGRLISKDFLFAKMGVKSKVMALDLSPEEEAVLTAVLLTFTGTVTQPI